MANLTPSREASTPDRAVELARIRAEARRRGGVQAAKTAARWTGAGERTAKNWLAGTCAPSAGHLVDLMRSSDLALDVVLSKAGRGELVAVRSLNDLRRRLRAFLAALDA